MSNPMGAVDISRFPELLDIVEEVEETKQPKALTRGNKVVALLSPVGSDAVAAKNGNDALAQSLAAIGSWSDLNAIDITRKIAEWRQAGSRP